MPTRPAARRATQAVAATGRLLVAAGRKYDRDRGTVSAAAVSYQVLFSLFPLTVLAVGVLGFLVRDTAVRAHVVDLVVQLIPLTTDGRAEVVLLLGELATLSTLGLIGAVGLLWSASGVIGVLRVALNQAWDVDERRPLVRGKLADIGLAAAVAAAVALAVALTVAARLLRDAAGHLAVLGWLAPLIGVLLWVFSIAVPLAVETVLFGLLYRVVPAAPTARRVVWPGAVVAAVGFEVVKNGFALYVAHLGTYNRVYGTLGAAVAFLFFVYLTATVFLFGAQVAAAHRRGARRR